MTSKEYSKLQVLDVAKIGNLPPLADETDKRIWSTAVGLVRKVNGSENYVLLSKDANGIKIQQDFGTISQIVEIVEIRPYDFIQYKHVPHFSTDGEIIKYLTHYKFNEDEIKSLLSSENKTDDQIKTDREIIKKYIESVVVRIDEEEKAEIARVCQNTQSPRITYKESTNEKKGRKRRSEKN